MTRWARAPRGRAGFALLLAAMGTCGRQDTEAVRLQGGRAPGPAGAARSSAGAAADAIVFEEVLASPLFEAGALERVSPPGMPPPHLGLLSPAPRFATFEDRAGGERIRRSGRWGLDRVRPGLILSPGGEASFSLRVPEGAALIGAVAMDASPPARHSDGMGFEVHFDGEVVARVEVPPPLRPRDRVWHEFRVDLSKYAGKGVRVTLLATEGEGGDARGDRGGFSRVRVVRERRVPRRMRGPGHPSILLHLVDTLRADALGCYGDPRPASPHLDAIAREGLRFTRAISPSAWTPPAVASLFTGVLPPEHGVVETDRFYLAAGFETLAERLRAAGVTTAAFVASPILTEGRNYFQGFETVRVLPGATAREVHAALAAWLREQSRRQCFAYVHTMEPHGPYEAPEPFRSRILATASESETARGSIAAPYDGSRKGLGELDRRAVAAAARGSGAGSASAPALDPAGVRHLRRLYEADVAAWDDAFGGLLRELREEGLLEDTLVAVTSDHGEAFLEHGLLGHAKSLHEELVRVPLVLWGPGIVPEGVVSRVVSTVDLGTRLEAVATGERNAALRGWGGEDALFSTSLGVRPGHGGEARTVHGLRRGRRKVLWWEASGACELYDLEEDPEEKVDRLGGAPWEVAREDPVAGPLLRELRRRIEEARDRAPGGWRPPVDEDTRKALESLGYVR